MIKLLPIKINTDLKTVELYILINELFFLFRLNFAFLFFFLLKRFFF